MVRPPDAVETGPYQSTLRDWDGSPIPVAARVRDRWGMPHLTAITRRLTTLGLLAALAAAVALPGSAAAAEVAVDAAAITAAEAKMVAALNADRTALGLVPVRVDTRLMAIARGRSADMVAKDYFSHSQPDGRNVFDILSGKNITWYNAGEILAWNNYPMDSTVQTANSQWMNSPGHKAIVISKDFNYVGVGLAIDPDTGKKLWTAVYIKGPDRTAARAKAATPTVTAGSTSRTRTAKLVWSGYDPRLQVLTSGLKSFVLQRRLDGGAWQSLLSSTTLRTKTYTLWTGHLYEFRVAARDNKGNLGSWSITTVDLR